MIIETYENTLGQECVLVKYEDGSSWSGLKSVWDEMQEAKENGTISQNSDNLTEWKKYRQK